MIGTLSSNLLQVKSSVKNRWDGFLFPRANSNNYLLTYFYLNKEPCFVGQKSYGNKDSSQI